MRGDAAHLRAVALRASAALCLLALLAGCGGSGPRPPESSQAQPPAETRVGDVVLRVTTLPTPRLGEVMARQYGVARDPRTLLVVVGLRRGDAASETSLPGRVRVQTTDLLGGRQDITLREVRGDGFIDYVGTARIAMPDTLRYEVTAQPQDGPALSMRFHRDYFPQ